MIQVCNSGLPPTCFHLFRFQTVRHQTVEAVDLCNMVSFALVVFVKLPRIALISYFGLNSSIVEVMEPPNNFEIWGGLD